MAINSIKRHVRRVVGASKPVRARMLKRTDPNDPNRKKMYGNTYTERQLRLLSGDLSCEDVPMREITTLVNKARQMEDQESYETAKLLRNLKAGKNAYRPKFTASEAVAILDALDKKIGR